MSVYIYLVQHAQAKKEEEDPERGLTEKGISDIEKIARFLSSLKITINKIFHSPKKRALQTAEILNKYLQSKDGLEVSDQLNPLDDVKFWYEKILSVQENIMIVGHLPHLEKLASLILCGDKTKKIVSFKMASVVCIKKEDKIFSIEWFITPELVNSQ